MNRKNLLLNWFTFLFNLYYLNRTEEMELIKNMGKKKPD